MGIIGMIFCACGVHKWEKMPSEKEIVKGTGVHFIFLSEGIQKATQHCVRKECAGKRRVYRQGWVGSGVKEPKWERLSKSKEEYIDSLPNVFQA
ncbi:MAG: hypothetical protein WCW78_00685 [Candidatus Paceibacterota bacterium]|jgi:hypothetical protein